MEDQITIVAVGTRHEKNRRDRRELPLQMDLTLGCCSSHLMHDNEEMKKRAR